MPLEHRLLALDDRLRREVGESFSIDRVDLYGLAPLEQHTAIRAVMTACGDFPVVFVDGEVVCVGDIDADAIVTAVRQRTAIEGQKDADERT